MMLGQDPTYRGCLNACNDGDVQSMMLGQDPTYGSTTLAMADGQSAVYPLNNGFKGIIGIVI